MTGQVEHATHEPRVAEREGQLSTDTDLRAELDGTRCGGDEAIFPGRVARARVRGGLTKLEAAGEVVDRIGVAL